MTREDSDNNEQTQTVENESGQAPEITLEEKLAQAEAKAAEYLDGWQRARAEFANARKRLEKERADGYGNATADVLSKLLPIIDDFKRAFDNVPAGIAQDSWFTGIQLVHRKLHTLLENNNLEVIPSVGQPFDPNLHEAISQEPSDSYESGIVTRELQTGYRLGSRVIRPAMVIVSA